MQATLSRLLAMALCVLMTTESLAAESQFDNYEIRVVRPRFFSKRGRLELTAGMTAIMNNTFVYSLLATGLVTYHFSEALGLEVQGAYGGSIDRVDKETLDARFGIKTIILRTETLVNGRLVWTPSYGKFHLTSAKIAYFDTHLSLGAGMTGVRYTYDHCQTAADVPPEAADKVGEKPAPALKQYPTVIVGAGQRYFLSQRSSFRIGFELQRFNADRGDSACATVKTPSNAASATFGQNNLMLMTAWSLYL